MTDAPEQAAASSQAEAAVQFARTVPYWFLAIIGLIYASGFVVVTTHLERYGIRDVGTEIWKSRYIHIGVLSLVFPVMIVGTIYGLLYFYLLRKEEPKNPERPDYSVLLLVSQGVASGFVFLMLELAFYCFVTLSRASVPPSPRDVTGQLLKMMLGGVAGTVLAGIIDRHWWKHRLVLRSTAVFRWAVAIWVGWWFFKTGAYYWDLVREMWRCRGHALGLMTGFLLVIGYMLFALGKRWAELPAQRRRVALLLAICLIGPMYYLSLMGFAFSLFAYVPAVRGGGDYTVSPLVTVSLKTGSVLPRARVVEETSAALFLLDESEDPLQLRRDPQAVPKKLLAVAREQIAEIEYAARGLERTTNGAPKAAPPDRTRSTKEVR
jgi:hypothetical protein